MLDGGETWGDMGVVEGVMRVSCLVGEGGEDSCRSATEDEKHAHMGTFLVFGGSDGW